MSDAARRLREAVIDKAVSGPGKAGPARRRAAFTTEGVEAAAAPLLAKVTQRAWTVTDEDVAGARAAGLSEDEVFELTVAAALGQANRQLASALAAVDEALRAPAAPAASAPPAADEAGPQGEAVRS